VPQADLRQAKAPSGTVEALNPGEVIRLAAELTELAHSLSSYSLSLLMNSPGPAGSESASLNRDTILQACRQTYEYRRLRDEFFGASDLFSDPAWDILLDLFISDLEGRDLSITDACIGAAVPMTTALRWIVILEQRGLACRENDQRDARRVFLRLSAHGRDIMTRYCERVIIGKNIG